MKSEIYWKDFHIPAFQLEGLTGRMVDMVESSRASADRLCNDIDLELARSRRVMQTANLLTTGRLSAEKWKSIEETVIF